MTKNPYPTEPGFGLRFHHAKTALEKYGRDYARPPYSRGFDNCFENHDGDAVVWALMHDAVADPKSRIAEGIHRLGKDVWPHWLEIYEQRGKHAPKQEQLGLFPGEQAQRPASPVAAPSPSFK
jgi:hypothetical protein